MPLKLEYEYSTIAWTKTLTKAQNNIVFDLKPWKASIMDLVHS